MRGEDKIQVHIFSLLIHLRLTVMSPLNTHTHTMIQIIKRNSLRFCNGVHFIEPIGCLSHKVKLLFKLLRILVGGRGWGGERKGGRHTQRQKERKREITHMQFYHILPTPSFKQEK